MNIVWFCTALIISIGRIAIASFRWKLILAEYKFSSRLIELFKLSLEGAFVSNFLPMSQTGGDIYKSIKLGKKLKNLKLSASSLFIGRIHGLSSFLLLGLIGSYFYFRISNVNDFFFVTLALFSISIAIIICLHTRYDPLVQILSKFEKILRHKNKAYPKIYDSLGLKKMTLKTILKSYGLSIVFQLCGVFVFWCTSKSLHLDISIWAFFFVIPISSIISLLPISIGGYGVREGSAIYLFSEFGIGVNSAASLLLLQFSQVFVVACLGGILFLFQNT